MWGGLRPLLSRPPTQDLSKWKSRRKSVNSDIVKKKEEREQIEQTYGSGDGRTRRSLREMREER